MNWIGIRQMDWIDELNQKWQGTWKLRSNSAIGESDPNKQEIDRIFQSIVIAYTQPDRHYHNLQHIHHVLTTLDRFAHRLQDPMSVTLAAWFHDVIYDSRSTDNETKSAKLAGELLQDIGISIETIDRVQQLILATKGHQAEIDDNDLCIFLDADLAILGVNPERYQIYARSIRREYSWVSDELYREGRKQVLESFLQRQRLYHTDSLFDELESRARLNIQTEIRLPTASAATPTISAYSHLASKQSY
jgi:predicted metal-dependent HD superfamily phosphohydrolase